MGQGVATDDAQVAVAATGITKGFDGILALDRVSFTARFGQVAVVLGENGAGKSTLMKILAGEISPDSGAIRYRGQPVQFRSPRDAQRQGIGLIHQELSLFPDLTVAENIFAGHERGWAGIVRERVQRQLAGDILARLDERIDPLRPVRALTVGQQQVVEIAKALARDARVLIMDEPTSALSTSEVDALFRVISELRASGVAIIYISHRMDEIFRIGDTLTVLRDGRLIASEPAASVDMDWIYNAMLGSRQREALKQVPALRAAGRHDTGADPVLQVSDLWLATADAGRPKLDGISFELFPGEVLGVYGLLGAGKTEIAHAVAGLYPEAGGTIRLRGRVVRGGVPERIGEGIVLVPEDRQRDALVPTMSVADNVLLSEFGAVSLGGVLMQSRADRTVAGMIRSLSIRVARSSQRITALSGGNQQKTIIARALLTHPTVLIFDEPTRGIDIGAKAEIFQLVRRLADEGVAVLFASSELAELMAVTDRILVLHRGRVSRVFDTQTASENNIMAASEEDHGN